MNDKKDEIPVTIGKIFLVACGLEEYTPTEQEWVTARPGVQAWQQRFEKGIEKFQMKKLFNEQELRAMSRTKAWEKWQDKIEEIVEKCYENPFYSPLEAEVREGLRRLAATVRRDSPGRG